MHKSVFNCLLKTRRADRRINERLSDKRQFSQQKIKETESRDRQSMPKPSNGHTSVQEHYMFQLQPRFRHYPGDSMARFVIFFTKSRSTHQPRDQTKKNQPLHCQNPLISEQLMQRFWTPIRECYLQWDNRSNLRKTHGWHHRVFVKEKNNTERSFLSNPWLHIRKKEKKNLIHKITD